MSKAPQTPAERPRIRRKQRDQFALAHPGLPTDIRDLLAVADDVVTQREALRARAELVQDVALQFAVALFIVREDKHGELYLDVVGNDALENAPRGHGPVAMQGQPLEASIARDSFQWRAYERALKGEAVDYRLVVEAADGSSVEYLCRVRPLRQGRRVTGAICTVDHLIDFDELEVVHTLA